MGCCHSLCNFLPRFSVGHVFNPHLFLITDVHSTAPVRLANGNNDLEGRVEIYYSFQWGTVCDHDWDSDDATVVCRQLGFVGGTAYRGSHFGYSYVQTWLDEVRCDGTEASLDQCPHAGWGNSQLLLQEQRGSKLHGTW